MNPPPAPPPPPAKSGGVLKWVLIGCGSLTFVGMLCCVGGLFMGGSMMTSYMQSIEEAHKLIRTSGEVVHAIGEIRSIDVGDNLTGGVEGRRKSTPKLEQGLFRWKVQGATKSGVAIGSLDMKSMKLSLTSLRFEVDGGPVLTLK